MVRLICFLQKDKRIYRQKDRRYFKFFNPSRVDELQRVILQPFNYLISHPSPPLSEGLGEVPKSPPSYSIRKMGMVRLIQFFNSSRVDELQRVILQLLNSNLNRLIANLYNNNTTSLCISMNCCLVKSGLCFTKLCARYAIYLYHCTIIST